MMNDPTWPIAEAVYLLLNGLVVVDSKTITVKDEIQPGTPYPYITFGEFALAEDDSKTIGGETVTADLEVVSDYNGTEQVGRITAAMLALLKGQTLELTAFGLSHVGEIEKASGGGIVKALDDASKRIRVSVVKLEIVVYDE